jgi:CRP-like cAMP-binding protein
VLRRNAIDRALDELPIFSNFDHKQRRIASGLFEADSFAAGSTIYAQGDTSEGMSMHILLKGSVRLTENNKVSTVDDQEDTDSDDENVLREVANAGESFGEAALLTPMPPRAQTAVATSAVDVISLSRKAISEMSRSNSAIAQHEQQRRRRERRRQHALTLYRSDLEALAFLGKGTFGRVQVRVRDTQRASRAATHAPDLVVRPCRMLRVQLVRRRGTDEVFALKSMSKRKLIEARKVQSALNEKRILDMLEHPFCNSLATVFSDADPSGDVHVRCAHPAISPPLHRCKRTMTTTTRRSAHMTSMWFMCC